MYSLERFIAESRRFWIPLLGVAVVGLVTGFAVPMAASYYSFQKFYQPAAPRIARPDVLVIPTLTPLPTAPAADTDSEMKRLTLRNRRLEALVAVLRAKAAPARQHPRD